MGKVIKKQIQGMSMQMKVSLVLLLTIVSSVFMYEGWYKPKDAKAATLTYFMKFDTTTNLGIDGTANLPSGAPSLFTGYPAKTAFALAENGTATRHYPAGFAQGTATVIERIYGPVYSTAPQDVSSISASFALRPVNATDTFQLNLYDYDPAGAANNKTLVATGTVKTAIASGTTSQYAWTTGNFTISGTGRVAQNHRLLAELVYTQGGATTGVRVYCGVTGTLTSSNLTVTETAVVASPGSIQLSTATQSIGEAAGTVTITATRTGGTTGAVGISYATSNVTATAGSDYTSTSGTLSWAAGDAVNKTFTVPILQDTLDEVDETFTVTLSTPSGGATLGAPSAQTVTIVDDDTVPTVQLQSATGSGSEATTPAAIIVTLSAASGNAVNVNYTTANGTATAGSDYTLTSGTLTIPALSTSGTINVPITNDPTIEVNETFTVTLSTPVNAALGTPTVHTYTIIDNDAVLVSTITSCAGCHGNPPVDGARAGATGLFLGDHTKHASASTYAYACTVCHYNHGTNLAHSSGFKNITGSRLPRNAYTQGNRIPIANAPVFGSCGNTYCHSAGTGATGQAGDARALGAPAATLVWGTTTGTCASCHTGSTTTGPSYASGTPKANSHNAHRVTNGYTCNICHYATTTNGTLITAPLQHADKTYDVVPDPAGKSFAYTYASTGGTCRTSACHGGAGINLPWGANLGTAQCTKCHGDGSTAYTNFSSAQIAPGYGATGNDLANGTGVTVRGGTHQAHLAATTGISDKIHCGECHKVVTTVNAATHMLYTTSRPLFTGVLATAQSHVPSVTRTSGIINCNNTYCHTGNLNTGAAMTPAWNNSTYISAVMTMTDCKKCHNMPPNPGVAGVHSAIPVALTAFPVGATCNCHTNLTTNGTTYANIFTDKLKHINGITEGGHAFPYPGATHDSAANPITSCTGCHTNTSGTYPVIRPAKPDCRGCHVKASPGTGCNTCHGRSTNGGVAGNYSSARPNGGIAGGFPNYSGSHTKHVINAGLACTGCHNGYGTGNIRHGFSNTSGATYSRTNFKKMAFTVGGTPTYTRATMTCSTLSCHGTAIWGGRLGCVDCHATAINSPNALAIDATVTQRGAVVGEFTNTWSHKRSFTGTPKVVNADCIVCHMEGVKGGGTSGVHGNGYINLRDPDSGLNIRNVTFGGAGAGSYTEGATDVTFVRFKRDFSKRLELDPSFLIIAAVQQNHCLKCHDTAGATNANAQVPTTGLALKPFGVTITGHSAPFDSNGSGNVVDVNKSFLTSNASYHPVRGKQNNWFAKYSGATTTANMISPWRGPFATRGATVNATAWGYLISCWDCHAPPGTVSTNGTVVRSVTAHGAAATLRAPIRVAGTTATTNLCLACHKAAYTASSQHGANTAFTTGAGNMGTATFNNCSFCHAYSSAGGTQGAANGSTSTLRPLRGEDAHGFNDRTAGTVNSRWATSNTRPFGFIRNSLNPLIYRSVTASGDTIAAGTIATCTGTGGTCGTDMGNDPYGGGTY